MTSYSINTKDKNFFNSLSQQFETDDPVKLQVSGSTFFVRKVGNEISVRNIKAFDQSVEKLLEVVEKKHAQNPRDFAHLKDLEEQLTLLLKVKSTTKKLYKKTSEIFEEKKIEFAVQANEKKLEKRVQALIKKVSHSVCEILAIGKKKAETEWLSALEDQYSLLNAAIVSDKKDIALQLIKKGSDFQKGNKKGLNALFLACGTGDVDIVKALLKKNGTINLNAVDEKNGLTALHLACCLGHASVVKLLLQKGANGNKQNKVGFTPLHLAANEGQIECVKALLAKGVERDCVCGKGNTPLIFAAIEGFTEIVQLLLDNGASIDKQNNNRQFALFSACDHGRVDVVQMLIQRGAKVDAQDVNGTTSLMMAAQKKQLEIVKMLIANNADVHKKNVTEDCALHFASHYGAVEVAQTLIQHGAEVDAQDIDGNTPLMLAAEKRQLEVVKLLIANNADVNKKSETGRTALFKAARSGKISLVQALLDAQAEVDTANNWGVTPLMQAAHFGRPKIAELLLNKGADLNKKDNDGETALSNAVDEHADGTKKCADVIKLLVQRGVKESEIVRVVNGTSALHILIKNRDLLPKEELVKLISNLLKQKINLSYEDEDDSAPLFELFYVDEGCVNEAKSILTELFPYLKDTLQNGEYLRISDLIADSERIVRGHPEANPLALALLLGDETLLQAFAVQMSTDELLNKCKELEELYPNSNVNKFLFSAIFSPHILPKESLHALFERLRVKVDVAEKKNFKTALQHMLIYPWADTFLKPFFSKSQAMQERLASHKIEDFLEFFIEHPEGLINNSDISPLEVALLFGSLPLARAVASKLTRAKFEELGSDLKKRFPKTDIDAFLFNAEYELNPEHLTKILTGKIPAKPADSRLDDFLKLFDTMNLSDAKARETLKKFLEKVKARKGIEGDHARSEEGCKEFYDTVENGLCGIAHHLLTQPQSDKIEQQKKRMMTAFLREIELCGPKIRVTVIQQYNNVVRNFEATFDNLLYKKTTDQRSLVAEGIVPHGAQSTHDYIKVVKACGRDLGLQDMHDLSEFDDAYADSGEGINPENIKLAFFEAYTPFAIFTNVKNELAADDELREQYATWWQANCPQDWQGDLQEVFVEVKRLREAQRPLSEITAYLDSKNLLLEELEDEESRRQRFVMKEVYEHMGQRADENRFRASYIIQSLQKLNVLEKAVSFT